MFDWSDITRRFKDLRTLIDTKPVTRWGVVTNADPLLVQLDGDDRPLAGSPSTVVSGLTAGERVLCLVQNRRVTVIGRGGVKSWQTLPLASGFTGSFRYVKDSNYVEARFDISGSITYDTAITTLLPVAYRPSTEGTGITSISAYVDPASARPSAQIYFSDDGRMRGTTSGSGTIDRVRGSARWRTI